MLLNEDFALTAEWNRSVTDVRHGRIVTRADVNSGLTGLLGPELSHSGLPTVSTNAATATVLSHTMPEPTGPRGPDHVPRSSQFTIACQDCT